MTNGELKSIARGYSVQVFILTWLLYFPIRFWGTDSMQVPSAVGYVFSFIFYISNGWIWYWVASRHKDYLTSFFTGTSGLRFLLALAILGIYYLVAGKEEMMTFFLVFLGYYIITLLHHSIFFSRVSKRV